MEYLAFFDPLTGLPGCANCNAVVQNNATGTSGQRGPRQHTFTVGTTAVASASTLSGATLDATDDGTFTFNVAAYPGLQALHDEAFEAFRALGGLVGTIVGAQLVVTGASGLADAWGISGGFVGFSLVALGTSLPELVTTFVGARRGETDLIIGNLFGSNLFNSLAVGGVRCVAAFGSPERTPTRCFTRTAGWSVAPCGG